MVKISTICRSDQNYQRETKYDIEKVQRNTNPNLHQFQKAREYQRALVSTKIDKIFAKPFVGTMLGHSDAISCMAKCPNSLTKTLSGSYDGEVRCWDVATRKTLFSMNLHQNTVKGLTFSNDGNRFVTAGDDKIINLYDYQTLIQSNDVQNSEPMQKYISKQPLGNVDHSWKSDEFASSGQVVQIWNYNRNKPIHKFEWGADSILKVKFNPSQPNILAATGIDRSVVLYDIRGETPLGKVFLPNKSHALCWNPTEPINFTVGSDDANAYSFDMRQMKEAKFIHKDHIGAIMDLDYSPTGKEFVTGSYDKTIRIFGAQKGRSREVYHAKRMQIIYSILWSMDNEYILSGSDDMNIRIWKQQSSKPLGVIGKRQETAINYRKTVQDKFKHVKEIRRIANHRHLPKYIQNAKGRKQEHKESQFRKEKNREIHNANIWKKPDPERKQKIVGQEE